MEDEMLTTYDNVFNPFTEFERWWKEDLSLGHDTCGILALNAETSPTFGKEVNDKIVSEAMKEIVEREPTIFRIVKRSDFSKSGDISDENLT